MLILGLESSCDETAAALVTGDRQVLAHRLLGQEAAHATSCNPFMEQPRHDDSGYPSLSCG